MEQSIIFYSAPLLLYHNFKLKSKQQILQFLPAYTPVTQSRSNAMRSYLYQPRLITMGCSANHLSQKLSETLISGTLTAGILTLGTLIVGVMAYAVIDMQGMSMTARISAKSFLIVVSSLFISNSIPIVLIGVHKTECLVRSCPMESTTFHITIIRYIRTR